MVGTTVTAHDLQYQLSHIHDNQGPLIIAVDVTLAIVAVVVVVLRFWARRIVKAPLKKDDLIIVIALVLSTCLSIMQLAAVGHGLGRHALKAGLDGVKFTLHALYVYEIIYAFTIASIKISILLLYHRLFPTPTFQLLGYLVGGFVTTNALAFTGAAIVQCHPIQYTWDKTLQGTCFNQVAFFKANSGLNIFTDIVLLIMPLFIVWSLSISWRQKAALTGIFLLGSFVCIASGVRLPYILKVPLGTDPTWTFTAAAIWSSIEVCLGIVCACLPVMRPLFRHFITVPISSVKRARTGYFSNQSSEPVPPGSLQNSVGSPKPTRWERSLNAFDDTSNMTTASSVNVNVGTTKDEDIYLMNAIRVRSDVEWASTKEVRVRESV